MAQKGKTFYTFLGANTPEGFYSLFDELIDFENARDVFILKGGPGTGKSGFMKKCGKDFEENGFDVEYAYCSSDPVSLDAVIVKDKGIAFVDGTAPHTMDPKYPGAVDKIINLGDFWDEEVLKKHKEAIKQNTKEMKGYFASAYRYLAAVKELCDDSETILSPGIDTPRIHALADRLFKKNFPAKSGKKRPPLITRRFLTGVTPFGVVSLIDRLPKCYENIYLLKDDYGVGRSFFERLAKSASRSGYDVVLCSCPLSPSKKIEHILIPERSLAFVTGNEYHDYTKTYARKINLNRYIAPDTLRVNKQKLRFNKKTSDLLLKEAVSEINHAKSLHDTLEGPYIQSIDFDRQEVFRKKLMAVLLK